MAWRVPLADLDFGEAERQAILDVLDDQWLTMGAVTREFERRFAEFLGVKHALAVSNATVALHLACLALDIGPGDEVILPSLTFVATANAVLYTGASPRFADILGPDELTISPAAIESLVTHRTKVIMVMHYGGYPCRMPEINELAARHNLALIEDAAHAPGASLDGRSMGTWGDVGCFSFFSNKNLPTGEGGMLVTNRDDIAQKAGLLRSHCMTSLTWDRHQGHAFSYDVVDLGYNYRIDELRSALGLTQLSKLEANNARRKALTERYWDSLGNTGLTLPFRDLVAQPGVAPAYHIFPILLPEGVDRKSFMEGMSAAGVQTSIHYPPIHQFSYHRKLPGVLHPSSALPFTEQVARREVTLPLYPTMGSEELDIVVDAVRQGLLPTETHPHK